MTEQTEEAMVPRALTAPLDGGDSSALPLALLLAASLHLFLILTVSFKMPEPAPQAPSDETLEILIMRDAGAGTRTPEPDAALSQRSRLGESPLGDAVISPPEDLAPEPEVDPTESEPDDEDAPGSTPPAPAPQLTENQPPAVLVTPRASSPDHQVRQPPRSPPPPPADPFSAPPRPVDAAQILASRNLEIDRLTESLETRSAAYASRQRRKSISASTREFRYASYLGAWARKVERIGNLNYPQAAKDQHIYGSLILDVAVRSDGSVDQIRVVQSSGYDLLDQAAVRIVQLAAPFSPFPPDIAAETDVLDVIRTWQFLRGGKLGWEDSSRSGE